MREGLEKLRRRRKSSRKKYKDAMLILRSIYGCGWLFQEDRCANALFIVAAWLQLACCMVGCVFVGGTAVGLWCIFDDEFGASNCYDVDWFAYVIIIAGPIMCVLCSSIASCCCCCCFCLSGIPEAERYLVKLIRNIVKLILFIREDAGVVNAPSSEEIPLQEIDEEYMDDDENEVEEE